MAQSPFIPADDAKENRIQAKRLYQEWLKVEKALDRAGIQQTIVFFGSARIEDSRAAELMNDKLTQLRSGASELTPEERKDIEHLLSVAQHDAVVANLQSRYYEDARQLARIIARYICDRNDPHTKLITGGGPGIMEAANRGAADLGQQSIGLNITIPHEQKSNPYISKLLSFKFHYFSLRKMHFLKRAKAIVVFPGGFGTLDELMEVLTLVQTGKVAPMPIILYDRAFWDKLVNFDFLAEQRLIDDEDLKLFTKVDDVDSASKLLLSCLDTCR